MKKLICKNKSCTITFSKSENEIKRFFFLLLKQSYFHFYFKTDFLKSNYLQELIKLKNIYKNIKIFIVHDYKVPFFQQDEITNLPIWTEKGREDELIENWLNKYCDVFCFDKKFSLSKRPSLPAKL